MSIRTLTLSSAVLCALALHPAMAADPAEASAGDKTMPMTMTLDQASQRVTSHAAAMDTNNDGVIDAEEFSAFHERQRAERMQRRFSRYDTDGDGKVTVEEFVAARKARMAAMDTDGDGVISAEEFRAARGKMQREGHSHRGQHQRGKRSYGNTLDSDG